MSNTASIPFMITNLMAARLGALGHTQQQINAMTPSQAWDILAEFDAPDATPDPALDFTLDDIAELNPDPASDASPIESVENTRRLLAALHAGSSHYFLQYRTSKGKLRTQWFKVGEPFVIPAHWPKDANIYFGVSGCSVRVTDADRAKPQYAGKPDHYIEPYVASKNKTLQAVNAGYIDIDSKDFTNPTPDEEAAAFARLRANPDKAKSTDKALWNEARGAAKLAKYLTDRPKYDALCAEYVSKLSPVPSHVVNTGGGLQCYWLFDKPFLITCDADFQKIKNFQAGWVKLMGGDPGAKDPRRILRLIGTYNYKSAYAPKFPQVHFVKADFELRYDLDYLISLLPAPEQTQATTKATRRTGEAIQDDSTPAAPYEGDSPIFAYNAKHKIRDILIKHGYTDHGERMSRPGNPESLGVEFNESEHPNQSRHWGGGDPLCDEHWRRPFDVFCEYEHKGNLKKAVYAAAVELGMVKHADVTPIIDTLRLWIKTSNLAAQLVGPGSKKLRLVIDAILDVMQANNRLSITAGKKRLAALAGVSPNTVKNVLALVNGKLFDVTPAEFGDQIVLLSNCRLQEFDPLLDVVSCLTTGGQIPANDKNVYSPHKADDAFATGISVYMKDEIKKDARKKDITYPEAKEEYATGLGEGVLLAVDTAQRLGDMTAQEYATEAGIKLSAARSHLRRAEQRGLAESHREGSRGQKVYTFEPDFWQRIEVMTPKLRTYKKMNQREDKRLERAQAWTQAEIEKAKDAGDVELATKLDKRKERQGKQRIPHLVSLYPDLSMDDIEDLAYKVAAYKRNPKTEAAIKAQRNAQREEHREAIRLVADLIAETIDAGTTKEDVFATVCKYGFDEGLVRSVLSNQHLVEHAAMGVGKETLARNIADYKAAGISKAVATKELQMAGFIPGEVSRAWDMVSA